MITAASSERMPKWIFIPLALSLTACTITYESDDQYTTRMGLVWESFKAPYEQDFSYRTIRTAGLGLDLTKENGGLVLGYKEVQSIAIEKSSELEVDLNHQQTVVKYCSYGEPLAN